MNSGIYKFLFVLHLLAVVVGFGGVFLNGVYDARAKRLGGAEGRAVSEANLFVSNRVAELAIYATPVLGFALVGVSDGVWAFDQTWIWLSTLLFVVGIGLSHGVLRPTAPKLVEARATGDDATAVALEKRVAGTGAALNVLVVILIALMVWKPGF